MHDITHVDIAARKHQASNGYTAAGASSVREQELLYNEQAHQAAAVQVATDKEHTPTLLAAATVQCSRVGGMILLPTRTQHVLL
jgi:hypothetical protein